MYQINNYNQVKIQPVEYYTTHIMEMTPISHKKYVTNYYLTPHTSFFRNFETIRENGSFLPSISFKGPLKGYIINYIKNYIKEITDIDSYTFVDNVRYVSFPKFKTYVQILTKENRYALFTDSIITKEEESIIFKTLVPGSTILLHFKLSFVLNTVKKELRAQMTAIRITGEELGLIKETGIKGITTIG